MVITIVCQNLLEVVCLLSRVYKYVGGNEFMHIMKKYFERKILSLFMPKPLVIGDKMSMVVVHYCFPLGPHLFLQFIIARSSALRFLIVNTNNDLK